MTDFEQGITDTLDKDAEQLRTMGYKQEFKREFNSVSIFCFTFSIMGVLASVSSTINFPMLSGGPVAMVYGWIIGSVMVMTVALSLAELVSAWPAAGGLYFFAARLSQHRSNGKWTPIVTWMTGWFNIIGNMALVTSIDYTLSTMVLAEVVIATDFAYTPTFPHTYGVFVTILFLHGLMGSLPTRWLARVNKVYVYFNMISSVTVIICLFVMSPQKNSAKWVFTHFDADTVGWPAGMAFMLGLIDVMWSLTGYDCAAHLSEECRDAATAAPKAIYQSVTGVATTGWILILAVAFTVPSIDDALASATGMPMAQIIYSNCGKPATLVLWVCIMLVQFFTGSAVVIGASRVIFAFSRDNALPFSKYWKKVNTYTHTPINAVWILVCCAAALCCLGFINLSALNAFFNVASIGLYISYAIPIFCRITIGRKHFVPGPFNLGKWSIPIGTIACAWVAFISVIFLFPPALPVTPLDMNYAVVVIGFIVVGAGLWFAIDARKWFHGPVINLEESSTSSVISIEKQHADEIQQVEEVN